MTLAQLLGPPVSPALTGVSLDKINVASSPLGGIPLGGIALGGLPLGGIPLGGIAARRRRRTSPTGAPTSTQQPGFTCPADARLSWSRRCSGLALQGVPLGGIPLGGIPLGGIPLGGIPLGGIAVGTPLGGIPLGGINLARHSARRHPARRDRHEPLAARRHPARRASLRARRSRSSTARPAPSCARTPTRSPRPRRRARSSRPRSCRTSATTRTRADSDITLKDLVKGLPPDTTLEDLLATVLLKTAYDWEALPLPGFPIQDFSTDGGTVTYTVSVLLNGGGPPVDSSDRRAHPAGRAVRPELDDRSPAGPERIDGEPTLSVARERAHLARRRPGHSTRATSSPSERSPGSASGPRRRPRRSPRRGLDGTVTAPDPAATLITEPGEPGNGQPRDRAAGPAGHALPRLHLERLRPRLLPGPAPPPGEQLTIHLSHLNVDDDLVIYGPTIAPLRTPHPGADAPTAGEVPFELGQRTQSITPEALADVPQDALGRTARSTCPTTAASPTKRWRSSHPRTRHVHDPGHELRRRATATSPWMLRVEESPAIPLPPTCTNPPAPAQA